jgi:hypothetical protein
MIHRIECTVCGARSEPVRDPRLITPAENDMLVAFQQLHTQLHAPQCGPFGSERPDPVSVRKPHGHTHRTGPYGEEQECDTLSCPHCRCHLEVREGTLEQMGWCNKCGAKTCGKPECVPCIPFEVRLLNVERGLPRLTPPPVMSGAVLLERKADNDGGLFETAKDSAGIAQEG